MADESRTLRIRCRTWDQVEAFYTEKLRGNTLVVKMPVRPALRETVTVALGLPDGLVFAIDGVVAKVSADAVAGKVPVALKLLGLTSEVRGQLERLVGGARAGSLPIVERVRTTSPPPRAEDGEPIPPLAAPRLEDVPPVEQGIFVALDEERRRLLPLAAHEVLGVPADADLPTIRRAYFALTKALHPDVHSRHGAPAIRQLASEVFLHVNKAYDRLRGAFAKEDRAGGPALGARDGWMVVADLGRGAPSVPPPLEDDSAYASVQVFHAPPGSSPDEGDEIAFTSSVRMKALTAEDLFTAEGQPASEERPVPPVRGAPAEKPLTQTSYVEEGQAALAAGQYNEACERFAAALKIDPRNRVVRALYHVAHGLDLRARGEGTKAQEQLEMALKHDPQCEEARRALVHHEKEKRGLFKKLFDK